MNEARREEGAARATSTRVLALLLVYTFNFLDRQILAILAIPLQKDLQLTNTQLGLMGGIAFASVYSTLAIPFARWADRKGRVPVIAVAVAVWSLFTALCGMAQNFSQIFLFRMGVGVGEAGGVAPSYALIADLFPPNRRARALAIFSLGIPIGSAVGLFFGGWLATALNWRIAFAIIGLAGLPLALLVRFFVTEAAVPATAAAPGLAATATALARKPAFWLLAFAAACSSICGYGFGFWLPKYFTTYLGMPLAKVGLYFGSIVLVGGTAGIYGGGLVADRLRRRTPLADALVPAAAFLLTGPLYFAAMSITSSALAWPLFALPYMLSLVWLGPLVSAVQRLVLPSARATASACFLLINNLIGIGFGTYLFGFLSDRLRGSPGEALRHAMVYGTGFYLFAALFALLAARRLTRDTLPG
ncbi:MAG: MFS transporter [Sphingomonadales bacterium]|nr:MFS transporter [Sphingomonadales bacterium]